MDVILIAAVAATAVLSLGLGFLVAKGKYKAATALVELDLAQLTSQAEHLEERNAEALERIEALQKNLEKEFSQRHEAEKNLHRVEVQHQEAERRASTIQTEKNAIIEKHDSLLKEHAELTARFTKLETSLDERQQSHQRELATFNKQKEDLKIEFKQLSNEILESKSKALQEVSKTSLSATINPFKESIESFKKQVDDNFHKEIAQRAELRKELEQLKELNQQITKEAHDLSTALKGQKKLQGNWGELVLENVLDRSGLQLGKDYKREVSFTTEEGRQRPDAVVYLPQDKHLIIDAKVSLNAYTRFINSEDEIERKVALEEHVAAMRARINELADRDYYKLPGMNSPEIVFMFVPIESAFVEALKADETLFQSAIENNVLVATPTTLLTSLNIVRQLWRYEDQNKHTAALAQKAEGVFKKLNTFLSSFEGVKKGLEKASEAYMKAENQLVSGKGNLVKQVGEFKNLAPAIKAELPEYFVDKSSLEIDFIAVDEQEASQ
jgi:DNA recombination protein RmuC